MTYPRPDNEAERLEALRLHHILDTAPEDAFDDLTRLAAHICGVPISAVSLVDEDRQWFKSIVGLPTKETPREMAFCAHTILQPGLMVVPDAQNDARFADNPLVTGDPHIRFYAGFPLITPDGHALGSLCVIDRTPRHLTPDQEAALRILARQVGSQLELTRRIALQERLAAETQQAEAVRRESEARFRSSVEAMEEGLALQDADGAILMCNAGAERILGLTEDQMAGRTSLDPRWRAVREDGREFPGPEHPAMISLREGIPQRGVVMGVHKPSGELTWISINTAPLFSEGEAKPHGVVTTFSDITEARLTLDALAESRRFAESVTEQSTSLIYVLDIDKRQPVYSNREAAEFLGYTAEQAKAMGPDFLFEIIHPDDRAFAQTHFSRFAQMADDEVCEFEMRVRHADGEWRWQWTREVVFKRHADGTPTQILGTAQDITERKQAEEERARLAAIVESSRDAIWAATLDGTIISWNRGAERLYGYAPEIIIGRHASTLAPSEESGFIGEIIRAILRGEKRENLEVKRRRTDGAWFDVSLTFSPIQNAAEQIIGIAAIGRDITAQKQAEAALRKSEFALRTVMEGAPIILYATDAQGVVTLSEGAALASLGLKPGERVGKNVFDMYPDVPEIQQNLRRVLAGENVTYDLILNGRCYHNDMRAQRDREGVVMGMIATSYDMTERRQAEEALRQSQESLEQAQAMARVGSWEIDCRSGAKRWSPEMFRLFGLPPAAAPPDMDWSLNIVHPDDRAALYACMQQALTGGTPYRLEHRVVWAEGSEHHLQARCEPLRDASGSLLALRGTAMDITERKMAEQALKDFSVVLEFQKCELEKTNAELESLAMLDGLTGLRNRRSFDTRLQEEFDRAVRYHSALSVVLLDIDRFKQYNDAYGHLAGDDVLRQVGAILNNSIRETDLVCRYGGEEIAIIMPETDGLGAVQVAERVRVAIAGADWPQRQVTASLGVCTLQLEMSRTDDLVAGADRALYLSKSHGRNRVTHERDDAASRPAAPFHSLESVA